MINLYYLKNYSFINKIKKKTRKINKKTTHK